MFESINRKAQQFYNLLPGPVRNMVGVLAFRERAYNESKVKYVALEIIASLAKALMIGTGIYGIAIVIKTAPIAALLFSIAAISFYVVRSSIIRTPARTLALPTT